MLAEIPNNIDFKTCTSEYLTRYSSLNRKIKSKDILFIDINQISDYDTYTIDHIFNKTVYNYRDIFILEIPNEIQYLNEALKKSEYILELEQDWDDLDSPKYDIETWKKSIIFLVDYSKILLKDFNKKIAVPKIYHGPKGTIDILWEENEYKLLINIVNNGENAIFYGSNNDHSNNIKGEISLKNFTKTLVPLAFNL